MDDGVIWNKSPHTAAKHNILRKYVQAWSAILALGSSDHRIIYIDRFAGPGEYMGGEEGSPILVLKSLKEHQLRDKFKGTDFVNIFRPLIISLLKFVVLLLFVQSHCPQL